MQQALTLHKLHPLPVALADPVELLQPIRLKQLPVVKEELIADLNRLHGIEADVVRILNEPDLGLGVF